ncbi:MAG: porin [Methylobacteriaceae bacterium]|nr:porin [Methylobacteriaceae bacterium]
MRVAILFVVAIFSASGALAAEHGARRAKAGGARQEAKTPNPCASYGPGFKMLPGTTTCVRIGGAVVGDFGAGSPAPNLGVK